MTSQAAPFLRLFGGLEGKVLSQFLSDFHVAFNRWPKTQSFQDSTRLRRHSTVIAVIITASQAFTKQLFATMARTKNKGGGRGGGGGQQQKKGQRTKKGGQQKQSPAKKGTQAKKSGRGRNKNPQQGGRRSSKGAGRSKSREQKKPATAEELDAAMDDYWLKSENKEVAGKKLDEDMDAYWAKKDAAKEGAGEGEATEEAKTEGEEGKTEES